MRFRQILSVILVDLLTISAFAYPSVISPEQNTKTIEEKAGGTSYRLPNNTVPILYDVILTTNVHSGDLNFQGEVKITIKVKEANTRSIVLHARQLQSFEASLLDVTDKTTKTLFHDYSAETEFLSLTPVDSSELVNNRIYEVTIKYRGKLREDNGGFYVSTYTNEAGKPVYMATTQFAPTDARHAFPCYDEPAKRANFTITINHDPSLQAISNMPKDTEKSLSGRTVFHQTPNMPTYLVAFIVSDFESTSGTLNNLTQRVFSRNGTQTGQKFALLTGLQMVTCLEDYFGVPYVLPKLDQVAIPDFAAGAMENWGLVTYREENLLYKPRSSTLNTQTKAANIIGHEYTHLWFGNLVTIKWWTWLWLKEGFANFFSYKATNEVYPEWDINQLFITDEFQKAIIEDGGNKTRPMTHYVEKQKDIRSLYDTIAYSKSGSVLRMWQHALTDDVFRTGLHKYLTKNKFTGAEEDDFFDALEEAAHDSNFILPDRIHEMMKTWTNQAGVPVLTVQRNYTDGSFSLTQSSFNNDPDIVENKKLWYVPVNFASKNMSDFRHTNPDFYLKNQSTTMPAGLSADEWLILNKQSTGYYRVNYDDRNWELLTESLIANPHKIHGLNRASLLFDAYNFVLTSKLQHKYLLRLMTYLRNEDQYAAWSTAYSILRNFDMFLKSHVHYWSYQAFVADLIGNTYDRLGMQFPNGEQHFTNNIRLMAINLACVAGVQKCLDDSSNQLSWLVEKGIEIEPNLQSAIYCNSLKHASSAEFDYMYNRLMTSKDQAERKTLISALGCTTNHTHLWKFVKSSIEVSDEVTLRSQERITLLSAAYSQSSVGLSVCIPFLSENFNDYAALNSGFKGVNPLDADIKGMSNYVVDHNLGDELMSLVDRVKTHPSVSADLESTVIANMKKNFDWVKEHQEPLMNWLVENYKISGASRNGFSLIVPFFIALSYVVLRFL